MKKLLNMNKKKLIIIVSIVFIIIIILFCLYSILEDKKFEDMVANKNYTSMKDFKSIKEVVLYMGCKYIKEEDSIDENYSKDIYLEFSKKLYENGQSQEGFYTNLVCYIANVLKYKNYNLIDKENNIYIKVECDETKKIVSQMTINGDPNYFGHNDSKNSLSKYKKQEVKNLEITSNVIKTCIDKNWNQTQIDFGTRESRFENYEIYFDEGIEVRTVGTKIFNIIFTTKYKEEILKEIKVGMTFDEIKQILGKPTFEDKYVIGYKGEKIYIFFSSDEVSIYRVEDFTDDGFEEFLDSQKDETNVDKIINNLTDIWPDYDKFTSYEDQVSITYSLRGIKLQYNISNQNGFTVYGNYLGNIKNGKNIETIKQDELPNNIFIESDKDAVFIAEIDRIEEIGNKQYICAITMTNDEKNKLNDLSKKFTYGHLGEENGIKKIIFYSLNEEYPKFEIEGNINSYMWLDDYRFLYSINNKGIYILNLTNREKQTVIEGKEKFEFKEYSNNVLSYDDKTISIK